MKTVLITGASGGIGRALCEYFEERNHRVIAHARTEDQARALCEGTDRMPVWGDLTVKSEVRALVDDVKSAGPLDVLVHNAGILSTSKETGPNDVGIQAEVNVIAPARLTRALVPHMAKSDDPVVVVISSAAANLARSNNYLALKDPNGSSLFGHYALSKAAANALVLAMAKTYPKVRFVSTEPGLVKTKMTVTNDHMPTIMRFAAKMASASPEAAAHRCFDHIMDHRLDSGSVVQNGKVINSERKSWGKQAARDALDALLAKADAALL